MTESFCAPLWLPVYLPHRVNVPWMGLCEALRDQESFLRPLRLPHLTILPGSTCVDLHHVLKFTSDFTLIIFFDLHNNPVKQAIMIISI